MSSFFNYIDTEILDKKLETGIFPFSKYLFWDTPIELIDKEIHKKSIIERVITRGFLEDFYTLVKMYSREEIVEAIKKSRVLDKKTANFCSLYFNIPLNEIHASSYYS
jgi:nicotinamide mononucleotide adenylyltransferase